MTHMIQGTVDTGDTDDPAHDPGCSGHDLTSFLSCGVLIKHLLFGTHQPYGNYIQKKQVMSQKPVHGVYN